MTENEKLKKQETELENKLSYASPSECGKLVIKLIKLKRKKRRNL